MSTLTTTELHQFRLFLTEKLNNGWAHWSLEEALDEWREHHPAPDEIEDDLAAVQAALNDVANGDRGILFTASYNVAPTQQVLAIRMSADAKEGVPMRWELIPSWAKDKKANLIHARADTLFEKPAFRASVKRRRCLILADGYYEWKTRASGSYLY